MHSSREQAPSSVCASLPKRGELFRSSRNVLPPRTSFEIRSLLRRCSFESQPETSRVLKLSSDARRHRRSHRHARRVERDESDRLGRRRAYRLCVAHADGALDRRMHIDGKNLSRLAGAILEIQSGAARASLPGILEILYEGNRDPVVFACRAFPSSPENSRPCRSSNSL